MEPQDKKTGKEQNNNMISAPGSSVGLVMSLLVSIAASSKQEDPDKDAGKNIRGTGRSEGSLRNPPPFSNAPPIPQTKLVVQENIARGFVLFVLAALVLLAGWVGYLKYDDLVKPNMPIFVCCLPSVIIAIVLVFFGFARRWTLVRRTSFNAGPSMSRGTAGPGTVSGGSGFPEATPVKNSRHRAKKIHKREAVPPQHGGLMEELEPLRLHTFDEVEEKRIKVKRFLEDLKEQYKDGLLMEETYNMLHSKYTRELKKLDEMKRRDLSHKHSSEK